MKRLSLFKAFVLAFILFSCGGRKLDLVEDPVTPESKTPETGSTPEGQPAINAGDNQLKPADQQLNQFLVSGNRIHFRDLSIAPSFHWDSGEFRLFGTLHHLLLAWDHLSYQSVEVSDIALFFHHLLSAFFSEEDYQSSHFDEIRNYALPIFLQKEIPPRHTPGFKIEQLREDALALYARGYNLNHLKREDLENTLKRFGEIAWKEQSFVSTDPLNAFLASLRDEGITLEREDALSMRRCSAALARRDRGIIRCDFGRFALVWNPVGNSPMGLILTATLDTGRSRESFPEMLQAYQKKTYWLPTGFSAQNHVLKDDYILAAAGPMPISLGPNEIPGNPSWPQNLRQTDWENMSGTLLAGTMSDSMKTELGACGTGILDAWGLFLRFFRELKSPARPLTSNLLYPPFSDAEILEQVRGNLWFLHILLTGHHGALGVKTGCETQALAFFAARYAWLASAPDRKITPELASLHVLFRILVALRTPVNEPAAVATGEEPVPSAPALSCVCDASAFPETGNPEVQKTRVEAAWNLVSQPETLIGFLQAKQPSDIQLISPEKRKAIAEGMEKVDLHRTYLPALVRPTTERVSYRRAKDALDYFLQMSVDARRRTPAPTPAGSN